MSLQLFPFLQGVGQNLLKHGCGSKPMGSHFGVGAPPILIYFSGDWDVHLGCSSGYDLAFDPWPHVQSLNHHCVNHLRLSLFHGDIRSNRAPGFSAQVHHPPRAGIRGWAAVRSGARLWKAKEPSTCPVWGGGGKCTHLRRVKQNIFS